MSVDQVVDIAKRALWLIVANFGIAIAASIAIIAITIINSIRVNPFFLFLIILFILCVSSKYI